MWDRVGPIRKGQQVKLYVIDFRQIVMTVKLTKNKKVI